MGYTCRFKDGNPEYDRYIRSPEWKRRARDRMEYDGGICCVCGKPATEVHHLSYANFRHEDRDDLISLCHRCHEKAEKFADPNILPWAMDEVKPEGNNFMAAMRTDASVIASKVIDYIREVRGSGFDALMLLRRPTDAEGRKYWTGLRDAVNALCRKRYSLNCAADRADMMLETVANRVESVCLAQIEHTVRNEIQRLLHENVLAENAAGRKWKDIAESHGISTGTLARLRKDDGTSFGPSLREAVLYYCGLDASAGIRPVCGLRCLTDTDYEKLNEFADYMSNVSGEGTFKEE